MQDEAPIALNLSEEVTEVTLVVFDLDLALNNKHSGGGEQRTFEKPYIANVRCRRELRSCCQALQQKGNVLFGFATFGTNLERVTATAKAMEIKQNPLYSELGIDAESGKNRHICNLVAAYRKILPAHIKLTRVVLFDDDPQNIRFMKLGDERYITVNADDKRNSLAVQLDFVLVDAPVLQTFEPIMANGKPGKALVAELDEEIDAHVFCETPASKAKYLGCLRQLERKAAIEKPKTPLIYHREALKRSCGREVIIELSEQSDDSSQDSSLIHSN